MTKAGFKTQICVVHSVSIVPILMFPAVYSLELLVPESQDFLLKIQIARSTLDQNLSGQSL